MSELLRACARAEEIGGGKERWFQEQACERDEDLRVILMTCPRPWG